MSTIGYSDWAVDLADVSAIYPFQGWEGTMTVIGVVFWLGWHIFQVRRESAHLEKAKNMGDHDKVQDALDRY
mgnify:CR=1 FL=1